MTRWLPLPFRGLQPLPLEGVERSLPGFIEALSESHGQSADRAGTGTQISCCACVAPLSSLLSAVGLEPRSVGRESGAVEGSRSF